MATAYDGKVVKVQGSLLGTFVKDNATNQAGRSAVSMVTPAAFVSVYPFSSPAFALRAFAKKSFRMPTFNELYYTEVGNASLKPETAIQYNLGFVLSTDSGPSWLGRLSLQADGYYNTVHDKVVAYPKGQQFRWTMLNLGRVHIAGVDVQAQADIRPRAIWACLPVCSTHSSKRATSLRHRCHITKTRFHIYQGTAGRP